MSLGTFESRTNQHGVKIHVYVTNFIQNWFSFPRHSTLYLTLGPTIINQTTQSTPAPNPPEIFILSIVQTIKNLCNKRRSEKISDMRNYKVWKVSLSRIDNRKIRAYLQAKRFFNLLIINYRLESNLNLHVWLIYL